MDPELLFSRYYNLALKYISYRPRSEKEVYDYLEKKSKNSSNLTNEIILQIMAKLQGYKFINDEEFVKFWVEQRINYKNKPLRVIEFELSQKGVSKDLINEFLENYKNNGETDLESAKKLAERKLHFYRNLDETRKKEKVRNFLLRKGFSFDIVRKVI